MGNNQNDGLSTDTEMTDSKLFKVDIMYEQYSESTDWCFGIFHYNKIIKKQLSWRENYRKNCNKLLKMYDWAEKMLKIIKDQQYPRISYLKQIFNLSIIDQQSFQKSDQGNDSQNNKLLTPRQIDQFKNRLKKSVLVSYEHRSDKRPIRIQTSMICQLNGKYQQNQVMKPSRMSVLPNRVHTNKNMPNKSTIRMSMISFVDETISSVMGQSNKNQIPRKNAHSLTLFLHFSIHLQKHMSNTDHLLYKVRNTFISFIKQTYFNASFASRDLEIFINNIKQFAQFLRQLIFDYYDIGKCSDDIYQLITNQDNLMAVVYSILFKEKQFYNLIFNAIIYNSEQSQRNFNQILCKLEECQPNWFNIKPEYCLNRQTIQKAMKVQSLGSQNNYIQNLQLNSFEYTEHMPYLNCIKILKNLKTSQSPVAKMKTIMECAEQILIEIKDFYNSNRIQLKHNVLDADQILSIFCYIICAAKIPHLHSHLHILENFSTEHQLISATGYYYSVLSCAIEQIQKKYSFTES